ncbi:sigma-70 family RNA polymerase sigma factor [Microbacterium abyssi]|uniref:sigma-70 family RNA polymerase sigma factor n=1 Tax=Microbacterium abyssi TaxID=2782166 RepID=UPI0018889232|nr:sigma-70 family RNA polymerase sigma factor [Microbacterium sp. A18JL241]
MRNENETFDTESAADADLILRARSGAGTAFAELWRRHHPSGIAAARSITSSIDPDELVQESFTRIHQAILKGSGPNGSFRAHLFTSIRNTAAAWGRPSRDAVTEELETVVDPGSAERVSDDALDPGLTARAFRSLPARWQEVLWYTEVERMQSAAAAPLLGIRSAAVSQLAFQAREGLREAWLQAQLRGVASDSECHWVIGHLGAHSRGNLSTRDLKRADRHFEDCARCAVIADGAKDVAGRLAAVLLPLVLGITAAAAYTAMVQNVEIAAIAAEPMPSSVVAAGKAAGGAPAAAPDMTGAGINPGGAITGIGALVGAGSAALVVAGVVAAATIVPGLVDASPVTSLPSAGDADGSSISSEVSPDGEVDSEDRFLLELSEDAPDDENVEPVPKTRAPIVKADVVPPTADSGASDERLEGGDGSEATNPPVKPSPTPEPGVPAGVPTWGPAEQTCTGDELRPTTEYSVPLTGVANAKVRIDVDGVVTDSTYTAILAGDGTGTALLRPTDGQVASNASVSLSYVLGDVRGAVVTISLNDLYSGEPCLAPEPPPSDDEATEPPATADPDADAPVVEDPAGADETTVPDEVAGTDETAAGIAALEPAAPVTSAADSAILEPVAAATTIPAATEDTAPAE